MEYFKTRMQHGIQPLMNDYLYYSWIAVLAALFPLICYLIRRIRKKILQARAQALLLEEDFIP